MTAPNPLVGAVVVRHGEVVGEGFHARAGEPHAEVNAVRDARRRVKDFTAATLYVNLEPCSTSGRTPPCVDAIIEAGLRRVVIGALDPNPLHAGRGVMMLRDAGVEVKTGVERAVCEELNLPFFKWVTTGVPLVMLKMATTLDGKIATASGESRWITGAEARARVQCLRRRADAILVGAGTVRADRPELRVREPSDWPCQPRRFVASTSMSAEELRRYFPDGDSPEVVALRDDDEWSGFLRSLGGQDVNTLLIEGGGKLAASALHAGVVDYVEFHIAPMILGGEHGRCPVAGRDPAALSDALRLERVRVARYGDDVAISGYCGRWGDWCLPG